MSTSNSDPRVHRIRVHRAIECEPATLAGASALPWWIGTPLLASGPVLTARLLIANQHRQILQVHGALPIALLALVGCGWNPFSFSIPIAILQFARDEALPEMGASSTSSLMNLVRLMILIPYLLFSHSSKVRIETTASLIGWGCGLIVIAPYVQPINLHFLGL